MTERTMTKADLVTSTLLIVFSSAIILDLPVHAGHD